MKQFQWATARYCGPQAIDASNPSQIADISIENPSEVWATKQRHLKFSVFMNGWWNSVRPWASGLLLQFRCSAYLPLWKVSLVETLPQSLRQWWRKPLQDGTASDVPRPEVARPLLSHCPSFKNYRKTHMEYSQWSSPLLGKRSNSWTCILLGAGSSLIWASRIGYLDQPALTYLSKYRWWF